MANLPQPPPATGIVLAGGASSRLGRDKAREPVGGRPMLLRAVDAVAFVCAEVLVVGDEAGREGLSLPPEARWVPDRYPERGPLAGLHAGLAAAGHDIALAVSCDMPFLNPLLQTLLLRIAAEGEFEAVIPRVDGRLQPLHAVYTRSCAAQAEQLLTTAERPSLHDLIRRLRGRYLDEAELRPFDPDLRSFLSVNTEEELERARRLVGEA